MAAAPSLALLAAMAVLGALSAFVVRETGIVTAAILTITLPFLVLALPLTLSEAIRSLDNLGRQLSWYHGLWLIIFLSGLVFRIRDAEGIKLQALDPWAAYRMSLVGFTALILVTTQALRIRPWTRSVRRGLIGVLMLYACISLASTLWSVYPAWTAYKSLEYMVDVGLLAVVLSTVSSVEAYKSFFDWTLGLYGFLLATVWLGILAWPGTALLHGVGLLGVQLYGAVPAVHANSVGELGATLGIVALSRLLLKSPDKAFRTLYWVLLAVGLATVVLAQTRSAVLGFLFGAVLVLYFSRRRNPFGFFIVSVALLLSLGSPRSLIGEYLQRDQAPREVQTLSGRVDWWTYGWQVFLNHPLAGTGAYTARFAVLAELGQSDTATMHSTYLEIIVGLGILGLVPLLVAFAGTWLFLIRAVRGPPRNPLDRQLALDALGVLAVLTVRSFFSTQLVWHPPLAFLAVLGYAEVLRRSRKYNRQLLNV
jgi:O-antigen ligase